MLLSLNLSAQILHGGLASLADALAMQLPALSAPELGEVQKKLMEAGNAAVASLSSQADRYIAEGDAEALRHTWLKMNAVGRQPQPQSSTQSRKPHAIASILQRLRKPDPISVAREKIQEAQNIVIVTGAGVSQESGVPTFRGDDGLWRNHRIEQVAHPSAFFGPPGHPEKGRPEFVWEFYQERRQNLLDKKPNLGHYAIAAFEHWATAHGKKVTLLTQNVDELHRIAGSENPVELHGNIWMTRCTKCNRIEENRTVPLETLPPHCQHCGGMLRPHIVWFHESYDPAVKETMYEVAQKADVVIVVGTSGAIKTVPSLISVAKLNEAYVIEVNTEETDITSDVDQTLLGKSGEILPVLLEEEERIRFSAQENPGRLSRAKTKLHRWVHKQKLKAMAHYLMNSQGASAYQIQKKLNALPKDDLAEIARLLIRFLDADDAPSSKIAIREVFRSIVNSLPPPEVVTVVRQLERRLEDPKPEIRTFALQELGFFPSLEKSLHLEILSKVEERFFDPDEDVRALAVWLAARMLKQLDAENLPLHLQKIEMGLDSAKDFAQVALIEAIAKNAPRLNDPEKLLRYAKAVQKKLEAEEGRVRLAAYLALRDMIPHLNAGERFPFVLSLVIAWMDKNFTVDVIVHATTPSNLLKYLTPEENRQLLLQVILPMESSLKDSSNSHIRRTYYVKFLYDAHSLLKPDSQSREEVVRILDDAASTPAEKEEALLKLAYSYGDTLSFGAARLLILKGMKKLRGEESLLLFSTDDGTTTSFGSPLGTQLQTLANDWVLAEARLKEHLTVGGKLRGLNTFPLIEYGFLQGITSLIEGEAFPLLLWPHRDPSLLTETIWILLEKIGNPDSFDFKLSLSLGGEVGDDLKYAGLAVHALAPRPYPFPQTIEGKTGMEWFAPVVNGGNGGIMGNIAMNNGHALNGGQPQNGEEHPRYDHFFLQFGFPPSFEHFQTEGDDEWRQALRQFVALGTPKILGTDPEDGGIEFEMKVGGEWEQGIYYPSKADWEKASGSEEAFQTFLFIEMTKMTAYQELSRVVEAAWALGVLREAQNQDEAVLPFSMGFTLQKLRALKSLAAEFEKRMEALLIEANIAGILQTPWVNNKDWARIREDMVRYQQTLQDQPGFQKRIQELAEEMMERVREILMAH